MHRLPDLRVFARLWIAASRWLDDNFERLFKSLREQCPEASNVWLADTIVTSTIDGTYRD